MPPIHEVLKERGKKYGSFDGHAKITQSLKNVIARYTLERNKQLSSSQQEALDMICHKIGRIINGDPNYIDSWVDIAGYAQLVADELQANEDFNSCQAVDKKTNELYNTHNDIRKASEEQFKEDMAHSSLNKSLR